MIYYVFVASLTIYFVVIVWIEFKICSVYLEIATLYLELETDVILAFCDILTEVIII